MLLDFLVFFLHLFSTSSTTSSSQPWYNRFSRAEWDDCIVPFNCYSELRKILTDHFIGWQFTTKCCVMQHKAFLITKMFRNANHDGGEQNQWTKNKREITFFEAPFTCWNLLRNKWKQPAVIWLLIFKQVLNCRSESMVKIMRAQKWRFGF